MSIKIDLLRHYILLAEEKSFSSVAEKISLTQSALSQQITQLENYFNCKVIDRSTRSFKLTKQGEILLKFAKEIVSTFEKCSYEISKLSQELIGVIKISASTIPGNHVLPQFIADFKNKNANVVFNIQIKNSKKSIEDVKNDLVDFAAIGSFMSEESSEFEYFSISSDSLVFISASNHELLKMKVNLKFNDLLKYPFIARERGSGTRNFAELNLAEYDKLNQTLEMNSNESIISAVSKSNDLSLISETSAKKAEDAQIIKILNISDLKPLDRKLYFVKKKKGELNKVAKEFWDFLKIEIKIKK